MAGEDEEHGGKLLPIEFERIKGGKPFNIHTDWFVQLLVDIGQPLGVPGQVKH